MKRLKEFCLSLLFKKEPFTPHMLLKIVQMFGKDGKNFINLRFVLNVHVRIVWIPEIF